MGKPHDEQEQEHFEANLSLEDAAAVDALFAEGLAQDLKQELVQHSGSGSGAGSGEGSGVGLGAGLGASKGARAVVIIKLLREMEVESTAERASRESQRAVRVGVTLARVLREAAAAKAGGAGLLSVGTTLRDGEEVSVNLDSQLDSQSDLQLDLHADAHSFASMAELSINDQDALDAFVLGGYRAGKLPSVLADRGKRLEAIGTLLAIPVASGGVQDGSSVITREDRIRATLEAVARERMVLRPVEKPRAFAGWRLSDLVSVAAVLLIGASILWPLASSVQQQNQRAACAGNLSGIAEALGLYSNGNKDAYPVAAAGWGGWQTPRDARWWNVGSTGSNSANLFRLVGLGYATPETFACGGNPDAVRTMSDLDGETRNATVVGAQSDWASLPQVSYSFQIHSPENGATWRDGNTQRIILADRSPVVLRAVKGEVIFPMQNSPNHGGRGQNVLRVDGSVSWLETPMDMSEAQAETQAETQVVTKVARGVGKGNNIWLPSSIEDLIRHVEAMHTGQRLEQVGGQQPMQGREVPGSVRDTFLGP